MYVSFAHTLALMTLYHIQFESARGEYVNWLWRKHFDIQLFALEQPSLSLLQTNVMFSLYSVGRDERLFPDPLKFDPERWKRDETNAFAIQPFGYGPRGCYGKFTEVNILLD